MSMPRVNVAFGGWLSALIFSKITQTIVDHEVVNVSSPVVFRGTIQPLSPRQVALKPEGQRAWIWVQIHAEPGTTLSPHDTIADDNHSYRIMAVLDYTSSGFLEYHAVQDYVGE